MHVLGMVNCCLCDTSCVTMMVNIVKTADKALGKYSSLKSTKFCEAAV